MTSAGRVCQLTIGHHRTGCGQCDGLGDCTLQHARAPVSEAGEIAGQTMRASCVGRICVVRRGGVGYALCQTANDPPGGPGALTCRPAALKNPSDPSLPNLQFPLLFFSLFKPNHQVLLPNLLSTNQPLPTGLLLVFPARSPSLFPHSFAPPQYTIPHPQTHPSFTSPTHTFFIIHTRHSLQRCCHITPEKDRPVWILNDPKDHRCSTAPSLLLLPKSSINCNITSLPGLFATPTRSLHRSAHLIQDWSPKSGAP